MKLGKKKSNTIVKNALLFGFVWSLLCVVVAVASRHQSLIHFYKQRILQTCHCPYCDLNKINLAHFQPGSTNAKKNPFAVTPPHQQQIEPWLTCHFEGANFQKANLKHSNFVVSVRGYVTPLADANFHQANFTQANLSHSQFYGADLSNTNFKQANLQHSHLFLDNFHGAHFEHAQLQHTVSQVDAMHGWGSNFTDTSFHGANLAHAQLYGVFTNADFSQANLKHAKLVGTAAMQRDQDSKPFHHVNFTSADLTAAHLGQSAKQQQKILKQATLCHTKLPNGKVSNRDCK